MINGGEGREPSGRNWEFTKGVLFGILISAVCGMALFLAKNGTLGTEWFGSGETGTEALTSRETLKKLEEVARRIDESSLYEADGEQLTDYLFMGVAAGLDDPYASYYSAGELQNVMDTSNGAYYGIGITLLQDMETGVLRIAGVYENSPAWEAGLKTDDQILAVDEETVTGMDLSQVVALIKEREDFVTLRVLRDGEEQTVEVMPATVEIPTVSFRMLENQTGYLRITEFDTVTVQQFKDALADLEDQGMESLIADVRDNPGGNLDSVCGILDELLPEGLIVYAENKEGQREEHTSDEEHQFTKPIAVLVNENSASASEIFAGVIQDYEMGPVVGSQTYGKGVVQRTYLLNDGSALKLTTDRYYTAKGQDIDGKGVTPDVVVEETEEENTDGGEEGDPVLEKAMELLRTEPKE